MNTELSKKLSFLDKNNRFKALFLLLLRSNDYKKSSILGDELEVSSRTIKNDIKILKKELSQIDIEIIAKQSKGYKLEISNKEFEGDLKEYFKIYQSSTIDNEFDTRVQYIIRKLLVSKTPVKVEIFQKELYVGNNSLSKELSSIKQILSNYKLKLITRPHYGIFIEGSEANKTLLIVRLYKYFDKRATPDFGITLYNQLFHCEDGEKEKIREIFYNTITKSRIVFSDIYAERFIVYLIYFRNKNLGNTITLLNLPCIEFNYKVSSEYKLIYEIIQKLKTQFSGFDFSEEIIKFLTYIAVISTDLYRFIDCTKENYDSLIELAETCRNYLLKKLSEYLQIDIFNDYTYIKDLLKIMLPISLKIKLDVSDDVDLGLYNMKSVENKPILLYYINKLSNDFFNKFGYSFSKREQHLILNTFLGMINRIVLSHRKLHLLIIAIDGKLSTQQLKFNLLHYFSEYIEKIETKVLYELEATANKIYDYYLCTNYGKNLNITYSPIYFAKEGMTEFEYIDSLKHIFFGSYEYNNTLPEISFIEMDSKYKFDIFPIEEYLQKIYEYEQLSIQGENNIKIFFNFNSDIEEFKIFYFPDTVDSTIKYEQFFIVVNLFINKNQQKLKMILNVFDKITENKKLLSYFCQKHEGTYDNFFVNY